MTVASSEPVDAGDVDPWDAELDDLAECIRMALAEGGYPNADVWNGGTGVFVEGPPQDVIDRAVRICGGNV